MRIPCLVVLALVTVTACSKPSEPEPAAAPAPQPAAQAPALTQGMDKPAASGSASASPTAGGLTWTAPKPLVSRPPKSSMRAAEYGVEGDPLSELAVFYFGADQGGGVEANIQRWVSQFKQADGTEAATKRSERSVKDITISTVETTGSYGGGMAPPGAPPPAAINDALLLGAIAKGPQGSVFFKLVGPRASVESARSAFDQLLESLHKAE
ncbi:MAG TPA: hypothetical protein VFN67_18565 [Polyangiales bacterium]|nr:hypothetical protein [Polyangiales bacterium]